MEANDVTKRFKEIIRYAYAYQKADEFFDNLTKTDLMILFHQLDSVYDALEQIDVVSKYSKFKILADFSMQLDISERVWLVNLDNPRKVVALPKQRIIHELIKTYTEL